MTKVTKKHIPATTSKSNQRLFAINPKIKSNVKSIEYEIEFRKKT